MFKLQRTPAYWWPVTVAFAADGGKWETETLEVQFVRLDETGFKALFDEVREHKLNDSQVAARVVLDWRAVCDAQGQVVPFSADNLAASCKLPGVAGALARAFIDSFSQAGAGN